jgi:hypothetical protein
VENFKNRNLCLSQTFRRTVGQHWLHLLPLLTRSAPRPSRAGPSARKSTPALPHVSLAIPCPLCARPDEGERGRLADRRPLPPLLPLSSFITEQRLHAHARLNSCPASPQHLSSHILPSLRRISTEWRRRCRPGHHYSPLLLSSPCVTSTPSAPPGHPQTKPTP